MRIGKPVAGQWILLGAKISTFKAGLDSVMSVALWTVLLLQACVPAAGLIDPEPFADTLNLLAREALGRNRVQELFDDVSFTATPILSRPDHGKDYVVQLADKLSNQLKARFEAVGRIKEEAKRLWEAGEGKSPSTYPQCCNLDTTNLERDPEFTGKVDTDKLCVAVSSDAPTTHRTLAVPSLLRVMQNNHASVFNLKYQYLGTEEGINVQYPASRSSDCNSYDPRFRPWYVETSTPLPKDLVLVIDSSGSMGGSRLRLAQEAAKTVIQTLNPNDRVGVVRFSDGASTPPGSSTTSTCYRTEMAAATPENKAYLTSYIDQIQAKGRTNYLAAIKASFELIQNTKQINASRRCTIIFLTDGEPTENTPEQILNEIGLENAKQRNKAVIMTFGLGGGLSDKTIQLLEDMAKQTKSDPANGEITPGPFTAVETETALRLQLGRYYDYFSSEGESGVPVVSVPYVDAFGLGVVTSICEQVRSGPTLLGVACVDARLADIIGDIANYQHGEFAYTFVIDGTGRALIHPLLPKLYEGTRETVFLNVSELEKSPQVVPVIENMRIGGSGSATFQTRIVQGLGNVTTHGQNTLFLTATYIWQHIAGTNLSICTVFTEKDKELTFTSDKNAKNFKLARFDLVKPETVCNKNGKVATKDASAVLFTVEAYRDAYNYLGKDLTTEEAQHITNHMETSGYGWDWFKDGTKETVVITEDMDDFWKEKNEKYGPYVSSRYIGTYNGVIRSYPGDSLPLGYNHADRPWYDQAMASKGKLILTAPYLDAFGAGVTVTLMHTIAEGKTTHSEDDMSIGVIAMDFSFGYLHNLIVNASNRCMDTSNYTCFLIDSSGYLPYHSQFIGRDDIENQHIIRMEPAISKYLIQQNLMYRTQCINVADRRQYNTWKFNMPAKQFTNPKEPKFEMASIPGTNLYIVIKENRLHGQTCYCPKRSLTDVIAQCREDDLTACECPCFTKAEAYDFCEHTFHIQESGNDVCVGEKPPTNTSSPIVEEEEWAGSLDPCFEVDCGIELSSRSCNGHLSCTWCSVASGVSQCVAQDQCEAQAAGSSGLGVGAIVGIVVGVILVVSLILGLVFMKRIKEMCRPRANYGADQESGPSAYGQANNHGMETRDPPTAPPAEPPPYTPW